MINKLLYAAVCTFTVSWFLTLPVAGQTPWMVKVDQPLENPENISPEDQSLPVKGNQVKVLLAPYSLTVMKVKLL